LGCFDFRGRFAPRRFVGRPIFISSCGFGGMVSMRRAICSVASSKSGLGAFAMPPRTFQFTLKRDHIDEAYVDLFVSYGHAMVCWAHLEAMLYRWFALITNMPDAMCRAIYYGARGFAARAEMLEAAIEYATILSGDDTLFLSEALKKARGYSGFRNKIAHGEPHMAVSKPGGEYKATFTVVQGRESPLNRQVSISIEDIGTAADNFRQLAVCIHDRMPNANVGRIQFQSPQECLSQVRALPNEPNGKSDPTATTSAQRPQGPVHRNKKAYRADQEVRKKDAPPPEAE
jgi:hypothetical protein